MLLERSWVPGRRLVGTIFGSKLRTWREARGISGNALAKLADMPQQLLNGIENGRRPPSDANLTDLAKIEGLTLNRLRAWRAADRIEEDLHLLVVECPELLGLPITLGQAASPRTALPHDLDALTGGARPLTPKERAIVERLLVVTGGDLISIQLGPDAPEWTFEKGKRLAVLQEILGRLDRPASGKAREERA